MASGFGWGGGRSRCFTYWQEVQKCYAQADRPSECQNQGADYLECLDNRKEIARAKVIRDEYIRQEQAKAKAHAHAHAHAHPPAASASAASPVSADDGGSGAGSGSGNGNGK